MGKGWRQKLWQRNPCPSSKSLKQEEVPPTRSAGSNRAPRHIFTEQDCGDW